MDKCSSLFVSLMIMTLMVGCEVNSPTICQPLHLENQALPQPPVVIPGELPGEAPSDAIILFDGRHLEAWESVKGGPVKWKVENGFLEIVPGRGGIQTKSGYGDCQLHIEWASPADLEGRGQDRGNSGVYLMGKYEVQVLDSYDNITYPEGQAAAIYAQSPPLVNACRQPGRWQSYDIIFHRPRFRNNGKLLRPAYITVIHNGILVQDHFEIKGETNQRNIACYNRHPEKLPLILQDHTNPVRYRNIWLRPLPKPQDAGA